MLVSQIKEEELSPQLIDQLLFRELEDSGETADFILVPGSIKAAKYRVPVAAQAYNAGRAGKVLLCGGKLRTFHDGTYSEAEHMRKAALKAGIAADDILLENASQNTVENMLFALIEMQRAFGLNNVHRVLLVTTAYHMRRSLAIARYLFPKHITLLPCPADDTNTRRNNWTQSDVGIQRVKNEAMKIVAYVNNRIIPDFEI